MRALSRPAADTPLLFHVRRLAVRRSSIQSEPDDHISIEVSPTRLFFLSLPNSTRGPGEYSLTATPRHWDVLQAAPIFRSPARPTRRPRVRARSGEGRR